MSHQALGFCQSFDRVGETKESVAANGLHADTFHKVGRRKPASFACPTPGREDVIAAGGVVAKRLRAPRAKENGARRVDFLQEPLGILRKAKVFRGEAIDECASLLERMRYENCSGRLRGDASHSRRKFGELPFNLALHFLGERV